MMVKNENDPDAVRWGLHLLDMCNMPNYGSSSNSVTQNEHNLSKAEYVREDTDNVENDEVIARALQEELSRIADVDACGISKGEEEKMQASILSQAGSAPSNTTAQGCGIPKGEEKHPRTSIHPSNTVAEASKNKEEHLQGSIPSQARRRPSQRNYYYEHGHYEKVEADPSKKAKELGFPSSRSRSQETSCIGGGSSCSLDINNEFALDGEVGKRFNQMVPVPHVPKVNGEIPTVDEEVSDHRRLLDRLEIYELAELKMRGDGNCQFRALSDQLHRSPEHHKFVREQIVNQLKYHPEMYEGHVPMDYGDYTKKMSKSGEWGDHITLQAAADYYGVKIFMITSFRDTCYIEILPRIQKCERGIFLSFWAEVHYNSLYPKEDLPTPEVKKKKNWWIF